MKGIKIGKVLGFEISIDWSWLLIFLLVTFSLARGYFPRLYPSFSAAMDWWLGVLASLLLFVAVVIHELSHSVIARRYGTEVKGITLFVFGGVSQTSDEPKSPTEEFWMALVGPLASIVLAGFFYGLRIAGLGFLWPLPLIALLTYLAWVNFVLGIFNLIPGFPLDGGRVLRSIIWAVTNNLKKATLWASYVGQGFGYLLIAGGLFIFFSGTIISGLWAIFVGWFLAGTARSSYQQLMVREALSGVPVNRVMTTDVAPIPADMSVRQFVDEFLLRHDYACYPVVNGDDVMGVIGAEEVRTIRANMWEATSVGSIAHRIDSAYKISPEDDAWNALIKLASEEVCRLVVMENNHLKGTVGRDSLYRLVNAKLHIGS